MPVASVVFAAFAPCLTVDFKLYGCGNLLIDATISFAGLSHPPPAELPDQ